LITEVAAPVRTVGAPGGSAPQCWADELLVFQYTSRAVAFLLRTEQPGGRTSDSVVMFRMDGLAGGAAEDAPCQLVPGVGGVRALHSLGEYQQPSFFAEPVSKM
jgi:hypothetical protein